MATSSTAAPALPLSESELAHFASFRRHLHTIPELAFQEHKTADAIRRELTRLGIPFTAGVDGAPTATIGLIGDATKPCVALRADIDALPIVERTGKPYASTHEGRMHACGHDGHTSTLLAAAAAIKKIAGELNVCVKLLFQPAEEGGGGGEKLVRAGALDGRVGPNVREVYGLHGWPGLPVGAVSTKPGPLLAATDGFEVTIRGTGCHGAFPHLGHDPIVAAAECVLNLQQFVSRDLDPTEPAVVTVGQFNAGTATNIIPDTAVFRGTARTLSVEARRYVRDCVNRRCAGVAAAGGCAAEVQWIDGYPATINDPAAAERVARVARNVVGNELFIPAMRPAMGGEDFAYYLEQVPGCFFLIGVVPPGRDTYPPLHSDLFDFTDAAIETGAGMFVAIVREASSRV
jgi:hippurate hydrolase